MYRASLIAQYIVKYCNKKGYPVNNLKLQKMLYFVQANFLANTRQPCFAEKIEAWDFGTVVPEVYYRYKIFGGLNIPYAGNGRAGMINDTARRMIDDILDQCAKYTDSQLADIVHHQAPWVDAYVPYQSNVISVQSIRDFFAT